MNESYDEDLNCLDFVKARAEEIKRITDEIESSNRKSMAFQRLPFHKRRRPRSYKFRRTRTKKADVWYKKRFETINILGWAVPLRRFCKSDKFIYKSFSRGFLFEEPYMTAILGASLADTKIVLKNPEDVQNELTCALLLGNRRIFGTGIYRLDNLKSVEDGELSNSSVETGTFMFLSDEANSAIQGRIIVSQSSVKTLRNKLVMTGVIPISINELLRIGTERAFLIQPYDIPSSPFFKELYKKIIGDAIEKWERTPPSKRSKCHLTKMFEDTVGGSVVIFESRGKGKIERHMNVYCGEERTGFVIRSIYSFSAGRIRGTCWIRHKMDAPLNIYALYTGLNRDVAIPVEIISFVNIT